MRFFLNIRNLLTDTITIPIWLMMLFSLLPTLMAALMAALFLFAPLSAEEARTLDPKKPEDAVQIVAQICAQVPLKMADSQAVLTALQTLAAIAQPKPGEVKPVEPEKAKP